ncbi:MAG TPA: hypothetical protein VNF68_03590 [Candidatus Baltobacteraceae bacterium]|nr:hypothetical protein [Candidatus Baltobacteraceae bacterium]
MSDPTPDFAMARAVEILANIYERNSKKNDVPPPPSDVPIALFNETIALRVGSTTRKEVETALGIAFAYPARGWHTYCVKGTHAEKLFVSIFYAKGTLAAAELYLPKVDRAPKLAPRDLFFRFVPSEITVGVPFTSLPEHFGRINGLSSGRGAYSEIFEARFPGGAAYAMCNDGIIERIAVYVLAA